MNPETFIGFTDDQFEILAWSLGVATGDALKEGKQATAAKIVDLFNHCQATRQEHREIQKLHNDMQKEVK